MRRIKSGFTIVEILITVAIIGILSTIGLVSFARYQQDARDAQRSSRATILTEALEKYYDKNGEYPSCPDITGPSNSVSTSVLPGIDKDALVTPGGASDDNSIRCEDLTTESTDDFFAYVGGDTSTECLSGSACLLYTIKYKEESTGTIKTIESRRQTAVAGVPVLTCPTNTFSQISCEWTSIAGASSYELQRATNSTFTNDLQTSSTTGLTNNATGLGYCTQYYFRVRTISASGSGAWSTTVSKTTACLSTPACSATANSFTQITASWGAITNATSYTLEYDDTSDFSSLAGTYTGTALSSVRTGLNYGTTYYFRVRASVTEGNSSWSSPCQVATLSLAKPVITSTTANSVSQITVVWNTVNSATSYTLEYDNNSDFSSLVGTQTGLTATSSAVTALTPGTTYYFRLIAISDPYTSVYSDTVSRATNNPTMGAQVDCTDPYSIRTQYNIELRIDETAYNISTNSSTVTWTAFRRSNNAAYNTWNTYDGNSHSVVVNGTTVQSGASKSKRFYNSYSLPATEQLFNTSTANTNTSDTSTINIAHNADGTKTISASISDNFPTGTPGNASCSISGYVLSDLR